VSTWDGNFNALMPKNAPYPCCNVRENLMPFEPLPDGSPVLLGGVTVRMVTGYRCCKVCHRKHYFARPEHGSVKVEGT
jgi:hypothetical protein